MQLHDLIQMLQGAVTPVVLISGVGLIILSMTNRLARVVDRARQLSGVQRSHDREDFHHAELQLSILLKRAVLLRKAILFATVSVLLAALLVIELFLSVFLDIHAIWLSFTLFILCLTSLIVALVLFIRDINLSLEALNKELNLIESNS